jgi:phage-related protein
LNQIQQYIDYLSAFGTRAGAQITKKIQGDIWELRLGNDRILYFCNNGINFVLLHYFRKKTQKTPELEIQKAQNEIVDFIKRSKQK